MPGSLVMTMPARSGVWSVGDRKGRSCTCNPIPWPRPWPAPEGGLPADKRLGAPPVDLVRGHSRFHQRHRYELRLTHGLDDAGLLGGWLANHDRSGGVAVVAGCGRAEVDDHHVPSLQDAVGRTAMGERTPLPSGHDGFEGWTG